MQLICVQFSQCQSTMSKYNSTVLNSVLFKVPTLGLNHCLKTLPGTAAHSADVIQLANGKLSTVPVLANFFRLFRQWLRPRVCTLKSTELH